MYYNITFKNELIYSINKNTIYNPDIKNGPKGISF
jgi:hypothetical protein